MKETVEKKAIDLARIFLSFYRKYTYKTFNLSSVKNSKWWPFFVKAIEKYSNLPDWDSYLWVACQFEKFGKIYPPQLVGFQAEEAFKEYKDDISGINNIKKLANNLVITYNEIVKWSKNNGFEKPNFEAFLDDKKMFFKIERGNILSDIFAVVKSYYKMPKEKRRKIMSLDKEQTKRALIMSNKKIRDKMKELLDEEFA